MRRKLLITLCFILLFIVITGCNKKKTGEDSDILHPEIEDSDFLESESPPIEKETEVEIVGIPEEDITDKAQSLLTGLYIDKNIALRRPVAVTINNYKKALPQSGIGQAGIFYETLAEGGITRIVALFQDFDAAKIGPVRSARHYFLDFAYDTDAIYVHHGWSPQARTDINNLKYPNINGMEFDGSLFWRDAERRTQPGMYEHSSYTNAKNILDAWDKKKYRKELDPDDKPMFSFHDLDSMLISGETAQHVKIPFSGEQISEFTYDTESKFYNRSQNNEPQIDELTGEQVSVKNILIQFTNIYVIKNDPEGRREVKTVGSGSGLLITNGMSIPVKWSRTNRKTHTVWQYDNGNELKLNKGKTWICILPTGNKLEIE